MAVVVRTPAEIKGVAEAAYAAVAPYRRAMMRNPGGDALDAVIAAVGAAKAVEAADHRAISRHPRYRQEGHLSV